MTRGRKPDPRRAARGTGHVPQVGKKTTRIVPQDATPAVALAIAAELPDGLPREMFLRATAELAGRLNDTDFEALRMMAWSVYRHQQAWRAASSQDLIHCAGRGDLAHR